MILFKNAILLKKSKTVLFVWLDVIYWIMPTFQSASIFLALVVIAMAGLSKLVFSRTNWFGQNRHNRFWLRLRYLCAFQWNLIDHVVCQLKFERIFSSVHSFICFFFGFFDQNLPYTHLLFYGMLWRPRNISVGEKGNDYVRFVETWNPNFLKRVWRKLSLYPKCAMFSHISKNSLSTLFFSATHLI